MTCDAIVYALTVFDSKRTGPLQLEIKKEGQKLGGSTTPIGNQAKTSPVTIVEVSKNLSLLCLQHISSWPKQERTQTIASRVESHVSSSGLHARKCLTSIRYNIARILREITTSQILGKSTGMRTITPAVCTRPCFSRVCPPSVALCSQKIRCWGRG